jgi:hypothetical protein
MLTEIINPNRIINSITIQKVNDGTELQSIFIDRIILAITKIIDDIRVNPFDGKIERTNVLMMEEMELNRNAIDKNTPPPPINTRNSFQNKGIPLNQLIILNRMWLQNNNNR